MNGKRKSLLRSENRVPIVAVSKQLRKPDDPSVLSGDRLHFPGVQAPEDQSHKVPEWLQPFEGGLGGEPPDSHNVVVEQLVLEPTEKTLDEGELQKLSQPIFHLSQKVP